MAGSQDAFARQLIEEWQAPIYNYALRWLRQPSDAEDATQEIFIAILRDRQDLRSAGALRAWIYKLASRVLIKHKERARRRDRIRESCVALAAVTEASPASGVEAAERSRALRRSVAALPERIRAAVMLKYFQGLTQQEVAEALELPRTTVRDQIKKGLELLRESLSLSGAAMAMPKLEALLASSPAAPVPPSLSSSLLKLGAQAPARALITGGLMTTKLKAGFGIAALALIGFALHETLAPEERDRARESGERRVAAVENPEEAAILRAGLRILEAAENRTAPERAAPEGSGSETGAEAKLAEKRALPEGARGDLEAEDAAGAEDLAKAKGKKERPAGPFPGFVSDRSLWITLIDQETREPVDRASVLFLPADEAAEIRRFQRAEGGRLLIANVKEGEYDLAVLSPGYLAFDCEPLTRPAGSQERIRVDAELIDSGLTIALIRGTALTGRVLDADLRPVEATVSAMLDTELALRHGQTKTEGGRFRFDSLSDGRFKIIAQAPGHPPATTTVELRRGIVPRELTLTLGRALDLRGRVLDGEGLPIAGARIEAMPSSESGPSLANPSGMDFHEGRRVIAASDDEGAFALSGFEAGTIDLVVMAPGYQGAIRTGLEVPSADPAALEFRLRPGGTLRGQVLGADGAPLKSMWVRLSKNLISFRSKEISEGGRFRFEGLPPGPYELEAHSRQGEQVTLKEVSASEEEQTVRASKGLQVIGRIETPAGGPKVSVLRVHPARSEVAVGLGGSFSVTLMDSAPEWLSISADGYLTENINKPKITPGEPLELVIKLRLAAAASGQVLDARGRPAGALRIRAVYNAGYWVEIGTDSFGRFRFTELEAGAVTLEARWKDGGKERVTRLPLEVFEGVEIEDLVLRLE